MSHSLQFSARADLPNNHPLTVYLYRLISIKRSNLCVSADVNSTSALLRLAEEVGDAICVLKTHADVVDDFSDRTIAGLREISRRKKFLIFEDRKFGDIGSTVQAQYTRGPLRIASWAHLTNAHIFPGPAIITALHSAADSALQSLVHNVSTEISAGTPHVSPDGDEDDDYDFGNETGTRPLGRSGRKNSVVTATTTISQTFEGTARSPASLARAVSAGEGDAGDRAEALDALGEPPLARGLLLLAEMSSAGNLMTAAYAQRCLDAARAHPAFVVGFIAQRALNEGAGDNFVSMTPGVSLPSVAEEEEGKAALGARTGDGLGQQYRTPAKVVAGDGCDVVIVGRGILGARDRAREAERYRVAAWTAYESRVGKGRR
ncbi:orotidine 5'-phosphate decarboxylase [Xylographa opegraphella]|nr:orotidine 5'-phosphate decarboxylase [Xylographa opegraphella]